MNTRDVRFGSGTDFSRIGFYVRFAPDNGRGVDPSVCDTAGKIFSRRLAANSTARSVGAFFRGRMVALGDFRDPIPAGRF